MYVKDTQRICNDIQCPKRYKWASQVSKGRQYTLWDVSYLVGVNYSSLPMKE